MPQDASARRIPADTFEEDLFRRVILQEVQGWIAAFGLVTIELSEKAHDGVWDLKFTHRDEIFTIDPATGRPGPPKVGVQVAGHVWLEETSDHRAVVAHEFQGSTRRDRHPSINWIHAASNLVAR